MATLPPARSPARLPGPQPSLSSLSPLSMALDVDPSEPFPINPVQAQSELLLTLEAYRDKMAITGPESSNGLSSLATRCCRAWLYGCLAPAAKLARACCHRPGLRPCHNGSDRPPRPPALPPARRRTARCQAHGLDSGFSGVQQRRPVTEGKGFKPLYAPGPVPSSGTTD